MMANEINDRGTKKWTSIMLPEHVAALKQMFKEEERKEKPILDDQKKMEINFLLQAALSSDASLEIEYYADYDYHTIKGRLLMIDSLNGYLHIDGPELTKLAFNQILDVMILD